MPRENYVVKQQQIGERLSRAMAKAHMHRLEEEIAIIDAGLAKLNTAAAA